MGAELEDFITAQLVAQREVYGVDLQGMTETARSAYIRENALALTHEVHEALNETSWKVWFPGHPFNLGRYLDELVDVQCFLLNLMLATGLSPQELAAEMEKRFHAKKKANLQRHGAA